MEGGPLNRSLVRHRKRNRRHRQLSAGRRPPTKVQMKELPSPPAKIWPSKTGKAARRLYTKLPAITPEHSGSCDAKLVELNSETPDNLAPEWK